MHYRVLVGKIQPGKEAEALRVLEQKVEAIRKATRLLFVQVLQSDDEIMVMSSWKTAKDLQGYAGSELALSMMSRLSPLFAAPPQIKSYEVKLEAQGFDELLSHDEGGEG